MTLLGAKFPLCFFWRHCIVYGNQRSKEQTETIIAYVAVWGTLENNLQVEDEDEMIWDRIVLGVLGNSLRLKLLQEKI